MLKKKRDSKHNGRSRQRRVIWVCMSDQPGKIKNYKNYLKFSKWKVKSQKKNIVEIDI